MSKLASQWIELFRAGDYGDKGTYSPADIQKIAENYKPSFHEAPLRIGHTDDDKAPAYGWLESLRASGDLLLGKFKQVVPAFAEAVERGSFKKRSVGLKDYGHGLTVRHVAFLGAVPPECKGLADIPFSADDKDAVEIEFSEEQDMTEVEQRTFNERMKAFFQGIFGSETAPGAKTFSETEVQSIASAAAKTAVEAAVAPLEARLQAQETSFSERETKLTTTEFQQRADAALLQVKGNGAYVPAFDKLGVPQLFAELAKIPATVTIEFSEGDKKVQKAPLAVMVEFMESLGKIVPSGAIQLPGNSAAPRSAQGVNSGAFGVDANSLRLHDATLQFAEANKVDYVEAQAAVLRKNPDLARVGGASAGAA